MVDIVLLRYGAGQNQHHVYLKYSMIMAHHPAVQKDYLSDSVLKKTNILMGVQYDELGYLKKLITYGNCR